MYLNVYCINDIYSLEILCLKQHPQLSFLGHYWRDGSNQDNPRRLFCVWGTLYGYVMMCTEKMMKQNEGLQVNGYEWKYIKYVMHAG